MCSNVELSFHDKIAELSLKQFEALPKRGKPSNNEWTILSGIIIEENNTFEVVVLGTGTKCIGYDKMSKDGDILNDSHAEIICRRAFLRYIYENMLSDNSDLFIFDKKRQNFKLKENVKFHFFSTHIPCGDAAIFAKQDAEDFGELIKNENCTQHFLSSKKRTGNDLPDVQNKKIKLQETDIYRTGAKCLESEDKQDLRLDGPNFHVTGVVRTKPGRGVPTLSVSCSDKIAKWCHLGMQGALLSMLLNKPIYLSSFTVGGSSPYNKESMRRALFDRLKDVQLQSAFCGNDIVIGQTKVPFMYTKVGEKSPCPSSIIWLKGENIERQIEVGVDGRRQGVTKKTLKTHGALKICKRELFKTFIKVIQKFEIKLSIAENLNEVSYSKMKMSSSDYQTAWSTLKKGFKNWSVKNSGLLDFCAS